MAEDTNVGVAHVQILIVSSEKVKSLRENRLKEQLPKTEP